MVFEKEEIKKKKGNFGSSKEDDSDSDADFVCDTCGEKFDTESGLKLHNQALH